MWAMPGSLMEKQHLVFAINVHFLPQPSQCQMKQLPHYISIEIAHWHKISMTGKKGILMTGFNCQTVFASRNRDDGKDVTSEATSS